MAEAPGLELLGRLREKMEAGVGIEPAYAELQADST